MEAQSPDHELPSAPPAHIRLIGRTISALVARLPWTWPLLRGPMERFWDRAAEHWDERIRPDAPERLATLATAVDEIPGEPGRILDLGTGTGAAALWLGRRFPAAEVVGVDLSAAMVDAARAKAARAGVENARFEVADAASLPASIGRFDLVVQVSVPVFFDEIARITSRGGHVIVISSIGTATPFHTPPKVLERGFARRSLTKVGEGSAGQGTYFIAGAGVFPSARTVERAPRRR